MGSMVGAADVLEAQDALHRDEPPQLDLWSPAGLPHLLSPLVRMMRRSRGAAVLVGFLVGASVVLAVGLASSYALPRVLEKVGPPLTRGEAIYNANCASCHGGPTGGEMMDYPPKHNANGHTWHHPDCELIEIIRTGQGPMIEMMREMMAPPGAPTMPAFRERLTDEEIDLVLAYIKTMWTPEERAVQEGVTREHCA